MYYIIDIEQNPPLKVPGIEFNTSDQACEWINENGNAAKYIIIWEDSPNT